MSAVTAGNCLRRHAQQLLNQAAEKLERFVITPGRIDLRTSRTCIDALLTDAQLALSPTQRSMHIFIRVDEADTNSVGGSWWCSGWRHSNADELKELLTRLLQSFTGPWRPSALCAMRFELLNKGLQRWLATWVLLLCPLLMSRGSVLEGGEISIWCYVRRRTS